MNVITIESEAFQQFMKKFEEFERMLSEKEYSNQKKETLSDVKETARFLKISTRTLQAYRDKGLLSFIQINGKIYFKSSDIEAFLEKHYKKAADV